MLNIGVQLRGLKSLTNCVMTLVAYGYIAIYLMADLKSSASERIKEGLAANYCGGESNIGLPAFLHSQMARDLTLDGIDRQSQPFCHSPKLSDRRKI